ncbi:GntR family transcriptional regulator [Streptomyces himalayensis]|uniref:GntR family transcriptional regulator n=1 Tax=Streptomyces himalayensis subsp. himalayensis TaxID=2756131 RepID=A0A7W0DJG3_9ACTN|nr:GntR family transcriptional regulator [Streptomyces himalayensis]MBA2945793.1 GntR family transcriptional regulator [Streptomyces himalayensis subsp. himalayensis]
MNRSDASREGTGRSPNRAPVVPRRALRDGVYDAILEKLLDGSTPPGSSMSIDSLARELGVSPTPVREALVQLENTGLVSRVALKGYRVAEPLSPGQMAELLDARTVLEVAAVERAVAHTDDLVPELRAAHAQHVLSAHRVRKLRGEGGQPPDYADLREYFTADWEFHLTIIRAADNGFLLQLVESLSAHVHRLRQTVDHGDMDLDEAVSEHAAILAAFESGDPQRPVEAMRAHMSALARRAAVDL